MKNIKIISFALVPVLLLISMLAYSIYKNDNSDVKFARETLKNIERLRIAIDKYYLESGEFPDLSSQEKLDNLSLIKFKNKKGEEKTFKDFLKQEKFPETPEFKKILKTNKVNIVESFKKVSNDGGWNYNIKTGEIHVNIPYNYFNQSIDWNNF